MEGCFKTCKVQISASLKAQIVKQFWRLRSYFLKIAKLKCSGMSIKNLYYTSKHDKTFLGRVRKHTTQLFDQKMLRDNNYLLIANVIVTLFNTHIDI